MVHWKARLRAAGIHFSISLGIAVLAAALVFWLWYPYPYSEISSGRELFLIVVSVDIVLGPLLTLAVFNLAKPRSELRRDLAVIAVLQLAGLCYGLWTVAQARPVHLVYEIDRFRVVHLTEVPEDLVDRAPPALRTLPWTGPTLLAVRPFKDSKENFEATMAALQGVPLGARPDLWEPYDAARPRVLAALKPLSELKARFPARIGDVDAAIAASGKGADALAWLPMVGRKTFWTVLVDRTTADVVGFIPLDSF